MNAARLVAAVALALVAGAVLAAGSQSGRTEPRSLAIGGSPIQLTTGRGSLWALVCDRRCTGEARSSVGRIVRIDPGAAHVEASVTVGRPQAIAVGSEGVFGLDFWHGDVYRLDPANLRVTARVHLVLPWSVVDHDNRFLPETISLGAGTVWVTSARGAVARIDPRSLRVMRIVRVEPGALAGVAAGQSAAWAAVELAGVAKIDSSTYRVTAEIRIERGERALSVGQTFLVGGRVLAVGDWTMNKTVTDTMAVARIDPSALRVEGVTLLPGPRLALTLADGSLWVAQVGGRTIERVDPATGRVTAQLGSGAVGVELAVAGGYVWTVSSTGTLTRAVKAPSASR